MPVEFNDENKSSVLYARFESSNKQPMIVRWLISAHLAKTQEQANGVLIVLAILALALAGFIFYRTDEPAGTVPTAQELQSIQLMNQGTVSHPLPPQQ